MRPFALAIILLAAGCGPRCLKFEQYSCTLSRCAVEIMQDVGGVMVQLCMSYEDYQTTCSRCVQYEAEKAP